MNTAGGYLEVLQRWVRGLHTHTRYRLLVTNYPPLCVYSVSGFSSRMRCSVRAAFHTVLPSDMVFVSAMVTAATPRSPAASPAARIDFCVLMLAPSPTTT